jgi:hypothetical protein
MFKTLYFKNIVQREKLGRIFIMWYRLAIDWRLRIFFLSYYALPVQLLFQIHSLCQFDQWETDLQKGLVSTDLSV